MANLANANIWALFVLVSLYWHTTHVRIEAKSWKQRFPGLAPFALHILGNCQAQCELGDSACLLCNSLHAWIGSWAPKHLGRSSLHFIHATILAHKPKLTAWNNPGSFLNIVYLEMNIQVSFFFFFNLSSPISYDTFLPSCPSPFSLVLCSFSLYFRSLTQTLLFPSLLLSAFRISSLYVICPCRILHCPKQGSALCISVPLQVNSP